MSSLRDSFLSSLDMDAMLRAVRRCAQGGPCTLTVLGFTLRLRPDLIAIQPAYPRDPTEARLKVVSMFLLRLSRGLKMRETQDGFIVAFEYRAHTLVGVSDGAFAWLPCEIVSYDPTKVDDPAALDFEDEPEPGAPIETARRRIVL